MSPVAAPACLHPETANQRWHTHRNWPLLIISTTSVGLALYGTIAVLIVQFDPTMAAWLIAPWGIACLFVWLTWFCDPKVRQKKFLRRYSWIEYDATVRRSRYRKDMALVTLRPKRWTEFVYRVEEPNDGNWEVGERKILAAGELGRSAIVIALRGGECTGMAYQTNSGRLGGPGR
jgi:hypothetical protein